MDKAYNEIVFHNDQSPDLDEINMNAISHGLSVVDDRVIQLKGDFTELPFALSYGRTNQEFNYLNAINSKGISTSNGKISDNASFWISDKIDVGNNTEFVSNTNIYKIAYYKNDGTFITVEGAHKELYVWTIPSDTGYMIFQIDKTVCSFENADTVILSFGNADTISVTNKYYLDYASERAKNITNQISDLLWKDFDIGTLQASNGEWDTGINPRRAIEKRYLNIDNFISVTVNGTQQMLWMAYDKNHNWLNYSSGWLDNKRTITKEDIIHENIANIKYVRFAFKKNNEGDIGDLFRFYEYIHFEYRAITEEINNIKELVNKEPTQYSYYGERICLPLMLNYEDIGNMWGGQGGCVYGDYLFRFNVDNSFYVYDLISKNAIGKFYLDGALSPHCNSACFGNERYDASDEFPLLYVNAYNTAGLPKGTCYVHRIIKDGNNITTSLVQTITIGFTEDSIWTNGAGDSRPYGNFCVDTENNYLYVYTLRDTDRKTRFFKFVLPKLSDGSNVTISKNSILEYWDCDYFPYIQDNHYYNGKLYLCTGYGMEIENGFIRVVDVARKEEVSVINLNKIGLPIEPECIDIYDGHLICGTSNIYKFSF